MKNIMKLFFAVVVAAGIIGLSSCHRQTCPTYTQAETPVQDARV